MEEALKSFSRLEIDEVVKRLANSERVLIIFHVNPDGDAVGSAFALRHALCELGKTAWCVCSNEVPERLAFAVGETQHSVHIDAIPCDFEPDLVVSVDTASPSQLGALCDVYAGKIDIMIDHHGKGTPYADNYIVSEASSSGEVLYPILSELYSLYEMELSRDVCELIYVAVSSDTGCFRYSNVSPYTHTLAASLIERGVNGAEINHKLFGIKSLKQMQVEHAGFERMNLYRGGRIAVINFP